MAESKVKEEQPTPADQVALAQLDRLIAFLDAHFGSIELLAPTEALAAQLYAAKEDEKDGEAREEGEFDAVSKEEDATMRGEEDDVKPASSESTSPPVSSAPILKLRIDDKDVYIPVDSMVSSLFIVRGSRRLKDCNRMFFANRISSENVSSRSWSWLLN